MENKTTEKQRLSKVMAQAGIASRRNCEEIIFEGRVSVNGEVTLLPQTQIAATDTVLVDGKPLPAKEKKVYYLLNKPRGYLCSNAARKNEKIVVDLFKNCPHRLFTVGRLDKETTGLLIVTNDGHFAQRVIHPSADIEKEYIAEVSPSVSRDHLHKIRKGTEVEGAFVRPKKVEKTGDRTVRVVVKEGKKREVRILLQDAGLSVKHLSRVRIGRLTIGNLSEGRWREMTEEEKNQLFAEGL